LSPQDTRAETAVELIDQLEELISSGRRVPFSASMVVNEDEVLELVDRIRLALPDDLVAARHLVEDRDRIVATAEQEAETLVAAAEEVADRRVAEAEQRAAALIAESAITAQAQERAESVVAEAESHAAVTREEADAYARNVMQQLEGNLSRALATIRKGIESLPRPDSGRRRKRT